MFYFGDHDELFFDALAKLAAIEVEKPTRQQLLDADEVLGKISALLQKQAPPSNERTVAMCQITRQRQLVRSKLEQGVS